MRLAGCIAIELAIGGAVAASVGSVTYAAMSNFVSHSRGQSVAASSQEFLIFEPDYAGQFSIEEGSSSALNTELDKSEIRHETDWHFLGKPDESLLRPLKNGFVTNARFNRGGSSVSLRLDFAGGAQAAFKPRQTHTQSTPRREIAAYRINRLLGLQSVPPAIGREFTKKELLGWLTPKRKDLVARINREVISNNGRVLGELSYWIPELRRAKFGKFRLDEMEGIVRWKRFLQANVTLPKEQKSIVGQISNLIAFDYLINNSDRWTGGNTLASVDRKTLFATDNTLSFGPSEAGHQKTRRYLFRVQRFSRSLVERARNISLADVRAAVAKDIAPFSALLSEAEILAFVKRRDVFVGYVDRLIKRHGEESVLVFP